MKKIFKFIFLFICFSFFTVVKAENYKTDNNGNYYVKAATCMYQITDAGYEDYKYEIRIKDAKIDSVIDYYKNKSEMHTSESVFNNLTYRDFFENKKFSCFNNLYINVYGIGEIPQGLRISKMEINGSYQEAALISSESYVTYEEAEDGDVIESKDEILNCHYTKQTLNSAGSNNQAKAPQSIDYRKYSDGTISLIDSNNKEYSLASGSKEIGNCDSDYNLQLFIEVIDDKYKIVNSCSDNDGNCIIYILAAYNGQGVEGLKPDGSLVDPDEIPIRELDMDIPEISNCNMLLGDPVKDIGSPAYYLVRVFEVIKYVAIGLLIVLSVMDFFSAIASQDKDILKKVANKMLRRFILCIIIFLLPYIIGMLLKYIANRQADICGIG